MHRARGAQVLAAAAVWLAVQLCPVAQGAVVGFAEYYVLADEADLIEAYKAIPNSQVPDTATADNINSRVCIVASADGTHVYLDEWEDGYDFDPDDPYNTADAKWDTPSGGPGEQGGALSRGEVLVLTETNAYVSGSEGVDGGDRIFISGAPVFVLRIVWPDDPGSYIAGSWEIYPVSRWQDSYDVPVGEDLTYTNSSYPFEYSFLFIEVVSNNTRIVVTDPSAGVILDTNLSQGANIYLTNVNAGVSIAASDASSGAARPVQAALMSSVNEFVDTRFFSLTPRQLLGSKYVVPAPSQTFIPGEFTGTSTNAAYIYALESNTTVNIETFSTNFQVTLTNRGDVYRYELPFLPADETGGFYAVEVSSEDPAKKIWLLVAADDDDDIVDWGYQVLDADLLAAEYYNAYAPANPMYIAPLYDDTVIWVDFENDGTNDRTLVLDRLEMAQIYDPDTDATGARVYGNQPFVLVWGQDNTQQSPGEPLPDYDYGYALLPLYWRDPALGIEKTADPEDLPSTGGVVTFTLVVTSYDFNIYNVDIYDRLPSGWEYVSNSTTISFSDGSSSLTNDPVITGGGELAWELDYDLASNQKITVTFQAQTVAGSYQYGYNRNDAWTWGTDTADETNQNAYVFSPLDTALVYIDPAEKLAVTKESDSTNGVVPGQTLTFTIVVTNSSTLTHTGVRVRDYLPTGVTYVADSTTIVYLQSLGSNTVRDEFNAQAYSNNDGSQDWLDDWVESEGDGPTAGDIQVLADVSNYQLRYRDDNLYIYRGADLSGATAAVLSLYYRRDSLDNANELVWLYISSNGTAPWTLLDTYAGPATDPSYIFTNYDVTAHIGTNTTIAFYNNDRGMGNWDRVWFDDIEIAFLQPASVVTNTGNPPPILADGYTLGPGQWLRVTYQVVVENPCPVTQIVNTAYVRSEQMLVAEQASVTDQVVAAALGDRVWRDSNTNGIQEVSETQGVWGVTVRLYDSGSNLVSSTQTDTNGYYQVAGLGAGSYFLEFVPPTNYYISPRDQGSDDTVDSDADPTNGRTVIFSVGAGSNDFSWDAGLYLPPGVIGDYTWFDVNSNGIQEAGESGMSNVNVYLYDGDTNLVDATQSDGSGYYFFENVTPGSYFLKFEQPPDYAFTLTDQGSDDTADSDVSKLTYCTPIFSVAPFEMATNWDAGYLLPEFGLVMTKTSDVSGCLSPGDVVTYTIEILYTGTVEHSIVTVYDPVPAGATYVSNSSRVIGYGVASNTVRDEFNAVSYSNNDGTVNWSGPWIENDPDGYPGPVGDYVGITNGRLRIHYAYVGVERIQRAADLSGYTGAVLSFDWETVGLDAGETISLQISTDGVNFTTLDSFGGTASGWTNYDISAYISPSTTVRYANESQNWEYGEMAFFDNVEISMLSAPGIVTNAGGSPPVLAEDHTLGTGQTLTVVFQVTVDTPGTVAQLVNTASVASASQPSISDVVTDCVVHADLALGKAVSDTSPSEGESIQYILTLTNQGPDDATGVEVSDLLPSGVTYHSHSNGVYNEVSGIWQVGDLAVGDSTSLYIMVGVDVGTAGTDITNQSSVSAATRYDPTATNNTGYVVITPVPTLVVLASLAALLEEQGVRVAWETASEIGTLGFNLLRSSRGEDGFRILNDALLPASQAPQGAAYCYFDVNGRLGHRYRLEEIDAKGRRRIFGPVAVRDADGSYLPRAGKAQGAIKAERAPQHLFRAVARRVVRRTLAKALNKGPAGDGWGRKRVRPAPVSGNMLKLLVYSNSLYYVSTSDLAAAFDLPEWYVRLLVQYRYLRLENMGQPVPYVCPDDFGGLCFYGLGPQNIFSDHNVYWLGWGRNPAMETVDGGAPAPELGQTFRSAVELEEDNVAATAVFDDPEGDFWLWDILVAGNPAQASRQIGFSLDDPAPAGSAGSLTVVLKGVSETRHHARVSLNGITLAECAWSGTTQAAVSAPFPPGLLGATNDLLVEAILDDGVPYSVFGLDCLRIEYARWSRATAGMLQGNADGRRVVTVEGFASAGVLVLDISRPGQPLLVENVEVVQYGGEYAASFRSLDADMCFAAGELGSLPAPEIAVAPSNRFLTADHQVDYLAICSAALADAAKRLAAFHQARGLRTMTVTVDEIYDVFNFGVPDPAAIRRFLDYAYTYWSIAPRYVVLVGKGSYDYRDRMGFGQNHVPVRLQSTPEGLFASDIWYADVVGDDAVPEMAIGRIPAVSEAEVDAYIGKLSAYESAAGAWTNRVLVTADDADDGGNFEDDSDAVAQWIGPAYQVVKIYLRDYDAAAVRTLLLNELGTGARVMTFMGHAGLDRLAQEGLLLATDAGLLANSGRLPVLIAITCVAGRFEIPGNDCLAEVLVMDADGGFVAALAPSGLSLHRSARLLADEFLAAVYGRGVQDLGAAVQAAVAGTAERTRNGYLLYLYNLIGDPAVMMR
ncbi:MAG TPA: DUF11 domain-containing protein [Kiritimatiellae bacterium]|nr:DUF11 domain-containing protein [Kiritimatiellia bacterium]